MQAVAEARRTGTHLGSPSGARKRRKGGEKDKEKPVLCLGTRQQEKNGVRLSAQGTCSQAEESYAVFVVAYI
jgi:hypothetical protein